MPGHKERLINRLSIDSDDLAKHVLFYWQRSGLVTPSLILFSRLKRAS